MSEGGYGCKLCCMDTDTNIDTAGDTDMGYDNSKKMERLDTAGDMVRLDFQMRLV